MGVSLQDLKPKKSVKGWLVPTIIVLALVTAGVVWFIYFSSSSDDTNKITKSTNTTTSDNSNHGSVQPDMVKRTLKLYYVAIGDEGASDGLIGCGDGLVATDSGEVMTNNLAKSALEQLVGNHNQYLGESGLYNALYQSRLTVDSTTTANNLVKVELSGSVKIAGECDGPRFKAQLEKTAMVAAGTSSADIYINGKKIDDVLGLK